MGLPISRSDYLFLSSWNSVASQLLTVDAKIKKFGEQNFEIVSFQQTPNTDRSTKTTTFGPFTFDGELESFFVSKAKAAFRGQTYCQVGITESAAASPGILSSSAPEPVVLSQGYAVGEVTFPTGRNISSLEGPGFRRTVSITAPANNADWTFTIPTNAAMQVVDIRYQFATAAAGSARQSNLKLTDGTNTTFIFPPQGTQAGGATTLYSWTPVAQNTASAAGADQIQPLPCAGYVLPAGYIIGTSTNNIGSTSPDNYTSIFLDVQEWISN